jgi:hypothetical protein
MPPMTGYQKLLRPLLPVENVVPLRRTAYMFDRDLFVCRSSLIDTPREADGIVMILNSKE